MKKKIYLSVLIIVSVILLSLLSALAVIIIKDQSVCFGRVFITDDGTYMLVTEDSLMKMTDLSDGKNIFKGLTNSDLVMIGHTAVAQSYPSQTGVYWCVKLLNGGRADIRDEAIYDLYQLGWISEMRYASLNMSDFSYTSVCGRIYDEVTEFSLPNVAVIRSLEELNNYYSKMGGSKYTSATFSEDIDEEYFKTRMLVMIITREMLTKTHIDSIGVMDDGKLVIFMEREDEESVGDASQWLYKVEFEKDIFLGDKSDIVIWCDGEKIFDEGVAHDKEVTK